jgi:hypothetical protein
VYIEGQGVASNINVIPAYNSGVAPFGSATGIVIHYFPVHDANRLIDLVNSQFDYAVIHLDHPFLNLGTMGYQSNFTGGVVNVTGYPGSANGLMVTSLQNVVRDASFTLLDGQALGEGSSGGPVWITSNGAPSVVGIVSSETLAGGSGHNALITASAFHNIQSWVQEDDLTPPINPTTLGLPSQSVFRFFDTHDGGHFFTDSTAERDQVLATRKDMTFEGVGYSAINPANNDPNASPVYRFFDRQDGGHFFTTSATERDQVIATRKDMNFEGIGFSEHTSQQAGDTAVYRFFETTSGGHFFTASAAERDTVQATRSDMRFEGVAFFAPT